MSGLKHMMHVAHCFKAAAENDGATGAVAGAAGVAGSAAALAAAAGLALTPLGWAVFLGAGATAGGMGAFKALRDKLG